MTPYRDRLHAGEYAPDEPPQNLLPEPAQTEDADAAEQKAADEQAKPAGRASK